MPAEPHEKTTTAAARRANAFIAAKRRTGNLGYQWNCARPGKLITPFQGCSSLAPNAFLNGHDEPEIDRFTSPMIARPASYAAGAGVVVGGRWRSRISLVITYSQAGTKAIAAPTGSPHSWPGFCELPTMK